MARVASGYDTLQNASLGATVDDVDFTTHAVANGDVIYRTGGKWKNRELLGSDTITVTASATDLTLGAKLKTNGGLESDANGLYVSLTGGSVSGTLPVSSGGTGVSTIASGELVVGAGTSSVTTLAVPAGGLVGVSASQTLTNKTITSLNAGSTTITALADPSNPTDAANKRYVDSVAQGLDVKNSVRVASTANLDLGATLDGEVVDGVTLIDGDRVLVKDQTSGVENGIYVVSANPGLPTRSDDMLSSTNASHAFTFIEEGTVNSSNGWVCSNTGGSGVVGTNALTWQQFSGAGQITAGDGLTKSGNTLSTDLFTNGGLQYLGAQQLALKLDDTAFTGTLAVNRGGTGASSYTAGDRIIATNTGNNALVSTSLDPTTILTSSSDLNDLNDTVITTVQSGQFLRYNGTHFVNAARSNFSATVAPSNSDDDGSSYEPGSLWVDTTGEKAYICVKNSTGSASWPEISVGGSLSTCELVFTTAHINPISMGNYVQFSAANSSITCSSPINFINSSGQVTYTGTHTRDFLVMLSVDAFSNQQDIRLAFDVHKSGTAVGKRVINFSKNTTQQSEGTSQITYVLSLAPNDTIDLRGAWIEQGTTDPTLITIEKGHLILRSL